MNPIDDTVPANDREPVRADGPAASGVLCQVLHTPADLRWFEGHFPGQPILPGIVQLKWAIEAAARLVEAPGGLRMIQQLKFKQPIRPGTTLELTLERVDEGRAVVFRYESAAGEHSSGRLCYGTA